ncbi:MAG: hypothetical protein GHCLOJNM_04594 [bacterium]|nr:hypothetical protein [bacterium]
MNCPNFRWLLPALLCFFGLATVSAPAPALAQAAPLACDVDRDSDIDRVDIALISAARGQSASGPDDPRDPDRDGTITVTDARICTLRCTLPGCASPPANRPPVADAGADQIVFAGATVQLNGSASSDPDGDALTYAWNLRVRPAGSAAALAGASTVMPTFVADVAGRYEIDLTVNDGRGGTDTDTVVVTTPPANTPPVANAGPDQQAVVGQLVTLDGSGSTDLDGDTLSFAWQFVARPGGSTATLSGAGTAAPTFVPDLVGHYTIQLTVSDGRGGSDTDTVSVDTALANRAPVANAGPDQSVDAGQVVLLDGSASSDPDGDAITYTWSFVSRPTGSTATLSSATSVSPSFLADRVGNYVVQLIVNDGALASAPDTVLITSNNVPPVANAGPDQTVTEGSVVQLDGSASSDANGDPLGYFWALTTTPAGSATMLEDADTVAPSFLADVAGLFIAQLIVNDGLVDSAPDTTRITVEVRPNTNPVAVDDAASTLAGQAVTIDVLANDTDADADPLTVSAITQPATGGSASIGAGGANVSFTPAAGFTGTTSFTYTASDGRGGSDTATVTVTVTALPTLSIGDVTITEGNAGQSAAVFAVTLSAASGQTVTVGYATANGTALAGSDYVAASGTLTFTPGTLSQNVTVQVLGDTVDEEDETFFVNLSAPVNATIAKAQGIGTIVDDDEPANQPPVANAGPDQAVFVVDTIQLDGSASTDPDGDPITYQWSVASAPAGAAVTFNPGQAVASPTVSVNLAGSYVFRLVVNDGTQNSAPDEVTVTVNAVPTLAINSVQVTEGDSGTVDAVFTVTLSGPINRIVTVNYATANGTATAGVDYVATSGTLSFPAGSTAPQSITVQVNGDTDVEPNETFFVDLTAPVNATIATARGTGTIVNDDSQSLLITPANLSLLTGESVIVTVSLPAAAGAGGQVVDLSSNDPAVVTVPSSVTVAEGAISANVTVTAGNTDGTAQITATAAGFAAATANVTVNARGMTIALGSPLVGVGRSVPVTATLAQPAPAGGVTVTFASSATGIATVAPLTVTIAAGGTQASAAVTGVALGNALISASAPGYTTVSAGLTVTNSLISFGLVPPVAPGQTLQFPVSLSAPAAGNVVINFTSANPAIATVTPSIVIPNGQQVPPANPAITGVAFGSTQILATATGFAPDSATATVTLTLTLTPGTQTIPTGSTRNLTLSLSAPAPAGGLTVALATGDPAIATVAASVTVPAGQNSAQVAVTGVAAGSTSLTASAAGVSPVNATINVIVAPPITLTGLAAGVGRDLQQNGSGSLGVVAPPPFGVDVTITSADPSRLLLSTNPAAVGSASITITVPGNSSGLGQFYAQALDGAGAVNITASADGYADSTVSVTLMPSGFIINSPSVINTTTFAANLNVNITSARLNPVTLAWAGNQEVRPGVSVLVPVTSSDPVVGSITTSPVVFGGNVGLVTTQFDPANAGTTLIAVGTPTGYSTPSAFQQITATVTASAINVPTDAALMVGEDLQDAVNISLGAIPPSPVDITVTLSSSAIGRVSDSATVLGGTTVVFPAVANQGSRQFFLQGLAQGTATLTVSAPGYATQTRTVTVGPSGFIINSPSVINTGTFAANSNLNITAARLNAANLNWAENEAVRAGLTVNVAVTSSDPAVGVITTSPLTFGPGVGSLTTQFDPLTAGTTTLAVVPPAGFDTPNTFRQITATVTESAINVPSDAVLMVGEDLRDEVNISLGAVPPSPVDITVMLSSAAIARVSNSATVLGGTTVVFPAVANQQGRLFFLHGLAQGTATLTVSAPGYATQTRTVTVGPSGFIINSPSVINTTTFAANSGLAITAARLNPANLNWAENEAVRAELTVNVAVTSSDPAVGVITTSPLTFGPGASLLITQFDPLTAGTTTLAVVPPAGFDTPNNFRQITATVTAPAINVPSDAALMVGEDLQDAVNISLGAVPPSPVDITVTLSSAAVGRVSDSATVLGGTTVVFPAVANQGSRQFFLQGLAQGTATLTVSAPGYATQTRTITVGPSAFIINSPSVINTTAGAANSNLNITAARLNAANLNWAENEAVRAGLTVNVTVTSSNPSVGVITTSPLTFGPNVGSLTTQFDPIAPGTSVLAVQTPAGFDTSNTFRQINANVNP